MLHIYADTFYHLSMVYVSEITNIGYGYGVRSKSIDATGDAYSGPVWGHAKDFTDTDNPYLRPNSVARPYVTGLLNLFGTAHESDADELVARVAKPISLNNQYLEYAQALKAEGHDFVLQSQKDLELRKNIRKETPWPGDPSDAEIEAFVRDLISKLSNGCN